METLRYPSGARNQDLAVAVALRRGGRKSRNIFVERNNSARKSSAPKRFGIGLKKARGFVNFKSVLVITLAIIGIGASVACVGAISLWLYNKAITSDFFTTRHIDVTGNIRLTRDMVLEYAGIKEGMNSLGVSISDVERHLRDTPWVEEVSVKRLLPDRFIIRLKERLPSFWIHKDGALFYANEKGESIAPVESKNFLSLPALRIMPGGESSVPYLSRLLKDINNGVLPIESGAIAQITTSPASGVEIYLEDREMRLSIATDDWDGNLSRLGMALGDLARRRELASVREARAVDGNVWIIRKQQAQE